MKNKQSGWTQKVTLICNACEARDKSAPTRNLAPALKDFLKTELKNTGRWSSNRVLLTSCLGLCPDNKIAVSICENQKDSVTFACNLPEDHDDLLRLQNLPKWTDRVIAFVYKTFSIFCRKR